MKNQRKPKTPVIAAHPAKKDGETPAASNGRTNGEKLPASRVPNVADFMDVSTLPEQNPSPVLRFTRDGELLYGNPAAVSHFGFSTGESAPTEWRDLVRSTFESGSNTETHIKHADKVYSALFVPVSAHGYVNIYCRDITVQKQTELALQHSEERLRLATQAARLCTWELDMINQTYKLGDNFEDVVGISKECLPANPSDVTDKINVAEDLQAVREVLTRCVNNRSTDVPPLQYRLRHPDTGQIIWVEVNARLVYNDDGKPESMSGMLQNITERKRLEGLMQAKEAELQDVIDRTPFMLTRCTRDLRYRFVSRAYAEMLGRKPEDVAGKSIVEIMGEEGWSSIFPYVEKVLNGERVEYESEISFKDVGTRSLYIIYTPDRDEHGAVNGWFASITDISTRKAAEQERNRALQREQWQRELAERAWVVAEESRKRAEEELSQRKLAETALGTWARAALPQETRPLWLRYGMALAATVIVISLRALLDPLLGDSILYSLPLSAVAFSVWYGGIAPAILSLLVGYLGITWLVQGWQEFLAPTVTTATSLGIFIISSAIIISLGETMRRAQRHAHQSAGVSVKKHHEVEFRLLEQERAEQSLRASEQRFREIFESTGVSVWVEDFSKVKMLIEDLRTQGVTDFRAHFTANPAVVRQAIGMVNVLDVNQGTLDLYRASSKEQLLDSLNAIFIPETESAFLEELVALAEGREMVRAETQTQTIDGQPISILFTVHFNPLYDDYSRVIVTITDITERKQMEQTLRASEQRFREIFESAGVSVWVEDFSKVKMLVEDLRGQGITDFHTYFTTNPEVVRQAIGMVNVLDVNQATLDLYRASSKEQLLGPLNAIFTPDAELAFVNELAALAEGREMYRSEKQTQSIDGQPISILFTIHFNPLSNDSSRVIVTITDITERKQMEQALRASEEKYRRIVETANEGIWEIDSETCTTFVNAHMAEMLGYSVAEMMGKSSFDFVFPEDSQAGETHLNSAKHGISSQASEFRFRRKDGSTLWALISTSPQVDEHGNFLGSVAMMVDITRRKQMEESLARERELFKRLFDTMPVMSTIYDPETGSMRMNDYIQELTGWEEADVTVESLLHALYPDPDYLRDVLGRMAAAAGKKEWVDVKMQTRDGRSLDTLWANISIMEAEKLITGISLGIDITERKRIERSLIEYARQQTALFKLAERLQHSHAPQEIYEAALDAILDALHCDRASILLFDETQRIRFVAWRGLSDAYRQATDGHSPWTVDAVNPEPIYVEAIETADFSAALRTTIKDEGISSLAFIPLAPNGRLIGKFMVYFNAPHTFSAAELDLSQTIARQLSFDIARKRAEERLRRSAELDAFRVAIADRLRPLKAPAEIRAEAMCLLGQHLQADGLLFAEVDGVAQVGRVIDHYRREDVSLLVGQVAVSECSKARQLLQIGQTLTVTDVALSPVLGEEDKSRFAMLGIASAMGAPIMKDGRWVATLEVMHGTARTWSEEEIALLEETAERTWTFLERVHTMERLRASEALYRTIARGIPGGGVYVVDQDMRYLVVEGPVTEAFGLSRQMLEGRTVTEVFPDERGTRMIDRLRRVFSGETVDFETNFNGRVYWTQLAPLYDSIGQAIILTLDITERKHAEEELRKAREAAEQTADRIAKLQEITSALAASLNSQQLTDLILEQGTRASGAAAGIMVEVITDGKELKTVAALGYPPQAVRTEPTPLSHKTPMSDAIQTKQAVWIGSHDEFAVHYPALAEMRRAFGSEAIVALPLIVDDRAVGGLAFSFVEKREFLLEERGFLLALAQQSAQGLERVRAAEALRESEQRFAGFMQHLPGLAWIKDVHGRYVFANEAAEKAFRVPRVELYGRTDAEVFPPAVAEQFRRNDEQALREARGLQVIEQLEHEGGLARYSLVNKFPILRSDGAVALIGGMAIDITERKQAEERLSLLAQISELTRDIEDADALMSAVANAVGKHMQVRRCLFNEINVEKDVEVVHHDYHDGVESVAGVHRVTEYSSITSAEMMDGLTIVNNNSETDPRTAKDYERAYSPHGERSYIAVPLMRDGRWAASLWVSDDKPRQWSDEDVALLQTVAERTWTACEKLRILGELRDSEERLRVTFNTTAVGFAMLAPDTQFVDVNQAFGEIVGYSRDELLTMKFDYLIHPDYVKSTRDHIRRLLSGNVQSAMMEKLYIRKDSSQVWVQNNMSLVRDVEGDPLHMIVISQDVTERKQIEILQQSATASLLAAAEANAKFRTFFDQGSYFAAVMTLDGTVIEANRLCLEFCGFTRTKVIGKKFWDCGWWNPSPELMEMIRFGTQRALQGETFQQETTYHIADGSIRYMDLIIAPIKDENGRILFLAPTGTDITERKHTEEELRHLNLLLEERVEKRTLQLETSDQLRRREMAERRQAQDRFAKSFNASPAAISITRFEDGMYRNVNPKFIELLEYELDEIIGHTSLDLKIYRNPQERVGLLKTIRDHGGRWNYETQLATKSGRHLDVSISMVEIELSGESHLLSMITDITERNQMMAALRASEQQLRTLFDVLPVGVAYISPDRKVIEPNRTLEKILDLSRQELLNGTYKSRQYIRPDGSPMPESEFASTRALREQRTINNVETGIIRDGGQVIWTSVSATPMSMPEPGVVVITVDVTDRKHMDDELRRSHRRYQILSRRLVEIQEEERRTISRELHDRVGQSLAALNLNLSFLNNSLSGTTSLQVRSRLKDAMQLTEETVSTIRDVMADLRPPALDDYGLEAALNAYADTYSRRFGIRVALMKPALPLPRFNPSIELTLLRIAQEALTNVARHANATRATLTLAMQDNMVYLSVEDNGEGIRSWQKANRPGSHGLKIMRERAETFGGTLQVNSFHGQGTRIEVKIPRQGNDQSTGTSEAN